MNEYQKELVDLTNLNAAYDSPQRLILFKNQKRPTVDQIQEFAERIKEEMLESLKAGRLDNLDQIFILFMYSERGKK